MNLTRQIIEEARLGNEYLIKIIMLTKTGELYSGSMAEEHRRIASRVLSIPSSRIKLEDVLRVFPICLFLENGKSGPQITHVSYGESALINQFHPRYLREDLDLAQKAIRDLISRSPFQQGKYKERVGKELSFSN